jgi:hypothetical protein
MSGAFMLLMNGVASSGGGGGGGGGGLTASIPPGPFYAVAARNQYTFGSNLCSVSGGTGPFTYQWAYTLAPNSDPGTWTTGTAASLIVTASGVSATSIALYTCTVTDSLMNKAVSNTAQFAFQCTL